MTQDVYQRVGARAYCQKNVVNSATGTFKKYVNLLRQLVIFFMCTYVIVCRRRAALATHLSHMLSKLVLVEFALAHTLARFPCGPPGLGPQVGKLHIECAR